MDPREKKANDGKEAEDKKDKQVFRRSVLDEDDKIEYRSIAAMARPQPFGPGLGHMHVGGPSMPTPFSMQQSVAKAVRAPKASSGSQVKISMIDPTSYISVTPKDLAPAPFRLEMHSHFHVKGSSLQRVCMVIGQKLMDAGADFSFDPTKAKWKVSRVQGASHVEFNLTIFKTKAAEHIVEFQRRQGDIVNMMELYGEMVEACKKQQLLSGHGAIKPIKRKRPSPFTSSPVDATISDVPVKDAVRSIKSMLCSAHSDVQLEGVLASISLSMTSEFKDVMAQLIPLLVDLTKSSVSDQVVRRCTSFALTHLCHDPECRRVFMNSDGWELIMKMAVGGPNVTVDLQRECLHILEILCPLYHTELSQAEGVDAVLQLITNWESIVDPRLKKHAYGAHEALKSVGLIV
jgi:hypothetical protein